MHEEVPLFEKPDHLHFGADTLLFEHYREHDMSSTLFYRWPSKYGGIDVSMMARMRELEEENRRLKKMYDKERLKAETNRRITNMPEKN